MALVAWYKLDGNTNDSVGLSPITVTTPFTYTTGKFGQAGTGSGYWPAATTASILNNNALSFSFWIYVTGNGGSGVIFGRDSMTPPNNRKFTFFQYPSINDLHLSWQNDDTGVFIGGAWTGVFPTGQWTHCAITYNNPTCKIYINGTLIYTGSGVSNSASFAFDTPVFHNSTARYIDDFKVYTHALSESEIKRLAGEQKSLVAHYKLDGNTNDSSGNGFNGTATTINYIDGVFKQGVNYNNSTAITFDFAPIKKNKISLSYWVRATGIPPTDWRQVFSFRDLDNITYFMADTRQVSNYYIIHYVKDYNISNWDAHTAITQADFISQKWFHLVLIIDDLNFKTYKDGVLISDTNVTMDISGYKDINRLVLNASGSNVLHVDDVRIYNYVLSDDKIKELSMPKILHYKFDSNYEEATENLISLSSSDAQLERSGDQYPFYSVDITAAIQARWSPSNNIITLSYEGKKSLTSGGYPSGYIYFGDWSWGMSTGSITTTQWTFNTATATMPNPAGKTIHFSVYHMTAGSSGISYSRNHQVEMKDHATAFVNGTRTGTIVKDHSLAENHGTVALSTTPKWVSGDISYGSLQFEKNQKIDTSISVNTINFASSDSQWTISSWVKLLTAPDNDATLIGGAYYSGFALAVGSTGAIRGYYRTTAGQQATAGYILPLNEWVFVSLTLDRPNLQMKLFINGSEFSTRIVNNSPFDQESQMFRINALQQTGGILFDTCRVELDDIRLYRKTLNILEIQKIYNERSGQMRFNNSEESTIRMNSSAGEIEIK